RRGAWTCRHRHDARLEDHGHERGCCRTAAASHGPTRGGGGGCRLAGIGCRVVRRGACAVHGRRVHGALAANFSIITLERSGTEGMAMSIYAERARFVPVEKGFNIKRPPIEPRAFLAEKERAFAADTPTGFIPMDLSSTLGTGYAATTPFMLARYARVRAGEALACALAASGEMWAVLRGKGRLRRGSDVVAWGGGDMLALPGGVASAWEADEDAVLWVTTDEPTLAYEGVRPELGVRAPIEPTLFPAE